MIEREVARGSRINGRQPFIRGKVRPMSSRRTSCIKRSETWRRLHRTPFGGVMGGQSELPPSKTIISSLMSRIDTVGWKSDGRTISRSLRCCFSCFFFARQNRLRRTELGVTYVGISTRLRNIIRTFWNIIYALQFLRRKHNACTVRTPENPKTCRIYVGIRSNIPPPNPSILAARTVPEAPCSWGWAVQWAPLGPINFILNWKKMFGVTT